MHDICKKVHVMVFAQLEAQHLSTLNSHHSHRVMAVESEINQGKKPSSLFLCHSANINTQITHSESGHKKFYTVHLH